MTKYVDLKALEYYHEKIMECIDRKIELQYKGVTNCPNCCAVITSSTCDYCGTDFTKLFLKRN